VECKCAVYNTCEMVLIAFATVALLCLDTMVQNPEVLTAHHAMWISDLQPVAHRTEMALDPLSGLSCL